MPDDGYSYAGYCHCGQLVAASVDIPSRADRNAELVAAWIRDGLKIERVSNETVRSSLHRCTCHPAAPRTRQEALAL